MNRFRLEGLSTWKEFVCGRCGETYAAEAEPEGKICERCYSQVLEELNAKERQEEADRARQAAAARLRNWGQSLAELNVPPEYWLVPPNLPVPPDCRGWRGEPWVITVIGPTGVGKSWLSTRIWGHLACELGEGVWIDASMAVERMYADMRAGRARTLDELLWTPALLLDDLLAERSDVAFVRDKLGLILRTRYNNNSPTVINGNAVDSDPESETYGQPSLVGFDAIDPEGRITSRLSTGAVVKMTGPDRRPRRRTAGG